MTTKNPGGRPSKFKSAKELERLCDEYFSNPPVKTIITKDGPIEVPAITMTGLAMHLGFASRQSLYDYDDNSKFSYIIKKARLHVENNYEFQLQHGNSTGAIFALKNMNWTDKSQQEISGPEGKPIESNMTINFIPVGNDDTN